MKCYKVVFKDLKSCIVKDQISASIQYKVNEKVSALPLFAKKGYHLTAFKTWNDAFHFIAHNCDLMTNSRIYLAEGYDRIKKLPPWLEWRYFNNLWIDIFMPTSYKWPPGTLMFKSIKLIKLLNKKGEKYETI